MAERAQGGGDAFNRGHQGFGRHLARLAKRLRGPCEEREHLEQFFGVAGGDAALRVHLAGAFGGQGGDRRGHQLFHPHECKAGQDQPDQRFEPGQAGGCLLPAPRQEHRLRRDLGVIGIRLRPVAPAQDKERMVDPADQPPPGQIGRPARATASAIARDPVPEPVLRPGPGLRVAHGGQIIQPREAVNVIGLTRIGLHDVPQRAAFHLDQLPAKKRVARDQLPSPGIEPNAARFGLGDKAARGQGPQGTPHRPASAEAAHQGSCAARCHGVSALWGCPPCGSFLSQSIAS